ncbi:hypothetical protein VUR80DRAFT_6459 [Thermomyces stellatus]
MRTSLPDGLPALDTSEGGRSRSHSEAFPVEVICRSPHLTGFSQGWQVPLWSPHLFARFSVPSSACFASPPPPPSPPLLPHSQACREGIECGGKVKARRVCVGSEKSSDTPGKSSQTTNFGTRQDVLIFINFPTGQVRWPASAEGGMGRGKRACVRMEGKESQIDGPVSTKGKHLAS